MSEQIKIDIPPQEGGGFWVAKGQTFSVIDPEGQQWAISINADEIDWLSTSQTRDITERLFPKIGESFYSENAKPLLTLVQDNSPCPHDMLSQPVTVGFTNEQDCLTIQTVATTCLGHF